MSKTAHAARVWVIELAACLATGVLLGAIGPFGSFLNDALVVRVAYWVIVFLSCAVALGLTIRFLTPRAQRARLPIWAWAPPMALGIAVPLAGFTRLVAMQFWPAIGDRVGLIEWYFQTLLIGLVYIALHVVIARGVRPSARDVPAPSGPDDPSILRHLPSKLCRDLLCLSMEDHYVRVHTGEGSVLILMSLGQAMEAVAAIDGLQVHRSWWVARHAVIGVVEEGRNLRLRLANNLEAPVSRASVAKLRQAGWLDGRHGQ